MGEHIAEAILYCLWIIWRKVGHATRSVDECIRQAKADMTIRTAILESRFLLGDRKLFDELVTRFDKDSFATPPLNLSRPSWPSAKTVCVAADSHATSSSQT